MQPVFPSRPQSLYVCLPALLECPPFQTERRESWCSAPQLPEELHHVVSVYQATVDLLRQFRVHPEIASQLLAYLFFFSSTLLFNQLLDKGEAQGVADPYPCCRKSRAGAGGRSGAEGSRCLGGWRRLGRAASAAERVPLGAGVRGRVCRMAPE